jgi:gamma-glutamyltranspeptidase/glutathione hydrolase
VPGTGIILNNEMDDFSIAPGLPNAYGLVDTRGANAIEPGKRPLSSMTPSIVLREGRLLMVTGSPGGPRIISTVLLSILNLVDYGLDVASVSAPRIHHQWQPMRWWRARDRGGRAGRLRERGHRSRCRARTGRAPRPWAQADTGWYAAAATPAATAWRWARSSRSDGGQRIGVQLDHAAGDAQHVLGVTARIASG